MIPSQLPVARAEEKYESNSSENWVFIPLSLGLPFFLGKIHKESAVKTLAQINSGFPDATDLSRYYEHQQHGCEHNSECHDKR